jgi:hypothetical protein
MLTEEHSPPQLIQAPALEVVMQRWVCVTYNRRWRKRRASREREYESWFPLASAINPAHAGG